MGPIVAMALAAASVGPARGGPPGPDPFAEATGALIGARSYKVRAQAALVLGRRGEPRATPFLVRALDDPSPVVRAVAARALGQVGNRAAEPRLRAAASDRDPFVRRAVAAALAMLAESAPPAVTAARPPGDGTIQVKPMGDKTHKASPRLRENMRRFVANEVEAFRGKTTRGFAIDGAIKTLDLTAGDAQVTVTCGVELILSAGAGGGIIVMSTGQATVQRHRRPFGAAIQADMEQEALAHAVRGAADELRQHLAANGP